MQTETMIKHLIWAVACLLLSSFTHAQTSKGGLKNDEVSSGLKQALRKGVHQAVNQAASPDGFYKNPALFIPFPPEADAVKKTALKLGMKQKVEDFEEAMNRAAEQASASAAPILVQAVRSLSITDGFTILSGGDQAATNYLRSETTEPLTAAFRPIVADAMKNVDVSRYWNPLASAYNKVPFQKDKVNPDLEGYITERALAGLFVLIAEEEKQIRTNPMARTTNLLKRVFR